MESHLPGLYSEVLEQGVVPHGHSDHYARRLMDAHGRMLPGQLLLRSVGLTTTNGTDEDDEFLRLEGNRNVFGEEYLDDGFESYHHDRDNATDIGEEDNEPSIEAQFLTDLESGTKKAQQYLDYVSRSLKYAEMYELPISSEVREAGRNLKKISNTVSEGLDQFGNLIEKGKALLQLRDWAVSLYKLGERTWELDLRKPETLEGWIEAAKQHQKRLKPLVSVLKDSLSRLALRGSLVAGRLSFFVSVFGAYAEVGLAALDAGTKNVNAYIKRRNDIIKKIFDQEQGQKRPPAPIYPGPWFTSAELIVSRKTRKEWLRRWQQQREKEERRRQAIAEFNKRFLKIYLRFRARMKSKILEDLRSGRRRWRLRSSKGTAVIPGWGEGHWWHCFMSTEAESQFDNRAGQWIVPKKKHINRKEAHLEIECFESVKPPCPYFYDLYREKLEAFLKQQQGGQEAEALVFAEIAENNNSLEYTEAEFDACDSVESFNEAPCFNEIAPLSTDDENEMAEKTEKVSSSWRRTNLQLSIKDFRGMPLLFHYVVARVVDSRTGKEVLFGNTVQSASTGTTGVVSFRRTKVGKEGILVINIYPEYTKTKEGKYRTRGSFVGDYLTSTFPWKRHVPTMILNISQDAKDISIRARSHEEAQLKLNAEGKVGIVIGPIEIGGGTGREKNTTKGSELEIQYTAKLALPTLKIDKSNFQAQESVARIETPYLH